MVHLCSQGCVPPCLHCPASLAPCGSLWLRDMPGQTHSPVTTKALLSSKVPNRDTGKGVIWGVIMVHFFPLNLCRQAFWFVSEIVWGVLMKADSHLKPSPVLHDRSFLSLGVRCACVWFRVGLHFIFSGALCSKYLLIPVLSGNMQVASCSLST